MNACVFGPGMASELMNAMMSPDWLITAAADPGTPRPQTAKSKHHRIEPPYSTSPLRMTPSARASPTDIVFHRCDYGCRKGIQAIRGATTENPEVGDSVARYQIIHE